MREYPKIDTLFERDAEFRLTDKLRRPVLGDISRWIVTEKIDGTNIRVSLEHGAGVIEVGGRTANAQIPADLLKHVYTAIPTAAFAALFNPDSQPGTRITLFGEGYGAGIQKGAYYRPDKGFILFDVLIEVGPEAWWQDEETVTSYAQKLGIPRVPVLGEWPLETIVERVRAGLSSVAAITTGQPAEGIVAKTREPLFDRRGCRLILKLKTRDFTVTE